MRADRVVLDRCDFKSFQDTLRLDGRVYVRECRIEGDVDFIWGGGTIYFDRCDILALHDGYLVQSRNGAEKFGYVFVDWQHQPHDHVLRDEERKCGLLASTCFYIAENPVRARLVTKATEWAFTGCIVPGYPTLHPLAEDFWEKFWRIHAATLARGSAAKIGDDKDV